MGEESKELLIDNGCILKDINETMNRMMRASVFMVLFVYASSPIIRTSVSRSTPNFSFTVACTWRIKLT